MATDKKSALIYCNWESTFDKLSDEEAGRLIKHLFHYINDRNPTPPDRITELVFEPIKAVLKEDLKKWDYRVDERSNSGKIGNLKRWNNDLYLLVTSNKMSLERALVIASERKASLKSHSDNSDTVATKNIANVAVNVNDNVNDNVYIKENSDIEILGSVFNLSFVKENFKEIYVSWINYLLKRGTCYTQQIQFELFYTKLMELSDNNSLKAEKIINQAIVKNWKDIYKLDENETIIPQNQNGKTVFKA